MTDSSDGSMRISENTSWSRPRLAQGLTCALHMNGIGEKAVGEQRRAPHTTGLQTFAQLRKTTAPEGQARHLDSEAVGAVIAGGEVLGNNPLDFSRVLAALNDGWKVDGLKS